MKYLATLASHKESEKKKTQDELLKVVARLGMIAGALVAPRGARFAVKGVQAYRRAEKGDVPFYTEEVFESPATMPERPAGSVSLEKQGIHPADLYADQFIPGEMGAKLQGAQASKEVNDRKRFNDYTTGIANALRASGAADMAGMIEHYRDQENKRPLVMSGWESSPKNLNKTPAKREGKLFPESTTSPRSPGNWAKNTLDLLAGH
jgi:hypothetical protein